MPSYDMSECPPVKVDGHKGPFQRGKVREIVANPEFQFPTAEMCGSMCLNSL